VALSAALAGRERSLNGRRDMPSGMADVAAFPEDNNRHESESVPGQVGAAVRGRSSSAILGALPRGEENQRRRAADARLWSTTISPKPGDPFAALTILSVPSRSTFRRDERWLPGGRRTLEAIPKPLMMSIEQYADTDR
jgi:hypothetical protein